MRVGIALGSNLGDRAVHLQNAVAAIRSVARPPILISRVYETAPVNCPPDSENFLNAAIEIEWEGVIRDLFKILQDIEKRFGRSEIRGKNAPRSIDLDILYGENLVLNDPDLQIPHPRIFERIFVLAPLCDMIPDRRIADRSSTLHQDMEALRKSDFSSIKESNVTLH